MLNGMRTTQIAVRIPDELLAHLDDRIPRQFANRAEAVRAAITALVAHETIEEREARHRRGWAMHPQSAAEERVIAGDARALIAEEPW